MRTSFIIIILLSCILPTKSVKAEPSLCNASAITVKEQEVVGVLQELYLLQSNLKNTQKILDKLEQQITYSAKRRDSDDLFDYKDLVNEYNRFVKYSNETDQNYNKLQMLYSNLIDSITPNTNQKLLNCLNTEKSKIHTNMTDIELNYLEIIPR